MPKYNDNKYLCQKNNDMNKTLVIPFFFNNSIATTRGKIQT